MCPVSVVSLSMARHCLQLLSRRCQFIPGTDSLWMKLLSVLLGWSNLEEEEEKPNMTLNHVLS